MLGVNTRKTDLCSFPRANDLRLITKSEQELALERSGEPGTRCVSRERVRDVLGGGRRAWSVSVDSGLPAGEQTSDLTALGQGGQNALPLPYVGTD